MGITIEGRGFFAAAGTNLKAYIKAYAYRRELLLRFLSKALTKYKRNLRNLKINRDLFTPGHFTQDKLEANLKADRQRIFVSMMQEYTMLVLINGTLRTYYMYYRAHYEVSLSFRTRL